MHAVRTASERSERASGAERAAKRRASDAVGESEGRSPSELSIHVVQNPELARTLRDREKQLRRGDGDLIARQLRRDRVLRTRERRDLEGVADAGARVRVE